MASATVTKATVFEDGGAQCMARIVGNDAANITQASISSIAMSVFDAVAGGSAISTRAPVVASTVFDTLQTDARWSTDSTGYNFLDTVLASELPTGGMTYRVEYKFTPASGQVFFVVFELTAKALGYTPYPITWFYAREGLKTGMVEGIIGGGAEGYAGLKDLARYYLPVNDHFEYWFVYMNLELWQSLSENEQTIIQNAAREMEMRRYAVAEAEEGKSLEQLRDQGTHIVAFSTEERANMRKKIRQSVWPLMRKEIGAAFDEVVSSVDGQ